MNAPTRLPRPVERHIGQRYAGWSSLATRILIVNLLALVTLAGGIFYLESFRARLLETRAQELAAQAVTMAELIARMPADVARDAVAGHASERGTRARLYRADGRIAADNWADPATPRFRLEDPTTEGFRRQSAILIDRIIDLFTGQPELPLLKDGAAGEVADAAAAATALATGGPLAWRQQTADRLVVLQAAAPLRSADGVEGVLLLTVDTPDVIDLVRRERATSFLVFLAVLAVSLAMSAYLARTIVVPLRQLAHAAHRVRLGRARDVVVPRLPHRRDEIGGLARALADMTAALRQRIDATEAFAADVAHELKNPLASMRSAVEALDRVHDDAARAQLLGLIADDVARIDRLITDIAAASRLDAELSRARFQPVDLAALVGAIVAARAAVADDGVALSLRTKGGPAIVAGDADRLGQVVNNLVDNAVSFSPPGGRVDILVDRHDDQLLLRVEDEGPGVPSELRDAVFQRFYSERPGHEQYGVHSGLGLSIARSIVEAMDGQIHIDDRADGRPGARFDVRLPAL